MQAQEPVTTVKGVGEALSAKLQTLGIRTIYDLVSYVPFRYEDYSNVIRVSQIRPGPVTIRVTFGAIKSRYSKKGLHMTEAMASDESGAVKVVWFNQPYRARALQVGKEYFVSGEFAKNYKYFAITNPACELVSSFPVNTARLVPVYRLTKGLGATQLRKAVREALSSWRSGETLPAWLIKQEKLMSKADALRQMHFPEDEHTLVEARRRLGFEEVFELALASELNKQAFKDQHALQVSFNEQAIVEFVQKLPFSLTDDQRKAAWQIFLDMQAGRPMNRLLEGDVGSGKTVVAALASIGVINAGMQVAFMAPTEILANQHGMSLHKLLENIGLHEKVILLTGSMKPKQKQAAYQAIASGKGQLIIGTHALFQESVQFHRLGLIIVDEQHRFGVEQRKALQAKANAMPHVLHMTATPIPRSLALTLYGELDVSVLKQMPPGRKPVRTELHIAENRQKIYGKLAIELDQGRQAFVVCPQIEADESNKSVKKVYDVLRKTWLKEYRLEMLHGKLPPDEKDAIMQRFVAGKTQVLVSTTVVEVGVDVPNATVMAIESAETFGLAQLHQLRGRVGRGHDLSYCYLIMGDNSEPTMRLKVMQNENDGFKLAEYDLQLRGPGAIYGQMQHGALDLRVARLTDVELIAAAKQAARTFIERSEKLLQYPELHARVTRLRTITNLN